MYPPPADATVHLPDGSTCNLRMAMRTPSFVVCVRSLARTPAVARFLELVALDACNEPPSEHVILDAPGWVGDTSRTLFPTPPGPLRLEPSHTGRFQRSSTRYR